MKILKHVFLFAVLFAVLFTVGCTLRFKATDVDLESDAVQEFRFDGIELTRDIDQNKPSDRIHLR